MTYCEILECSASQVPVSAFGFTSEPPPGAPMITNELRIALSSALLLLSFGVFTRAQTLPPPRVASVGECHLASGETIHQCRVAYREYGPPNASRTNTVLIPTWLLGRSDDWVSLVGTDGLVDTTRYHVVVVDALGDGLSSSPSNVLASERSAFANLPVGDWVESQYLLLTKRLGVQRLQAVLGFSMDGMQAI